MEELRRQVERGNVIRPMNGNINPPCLFLQLPKMALEFRNAHAAHHINLRIRERNTRIPRERRLKFRRDAVENMVK